MTADPKRPKPGDRFVTAYHSGASAEHLVTFVGRHLLVYEDGDNEHSALLSFVAETWQPAPEPLITVPLTFRPVYRSEGTNWEAPILNPPGFPRGAVDMLPPDAAITILPDGTWREGP